MTAAAPDDEPEPVIDWATAKRITRRKKGHERLPLRAARKALGKTQLDIADRSGMPQGDVSRLESRTAEREDLHFSTLARYARAIGGELEIGIVVGDRRYLIAV